MADIIPNTNQPLPKIINPLDEPLNDHQSNLPSQQDIKPAKPIRSTSSPQSATLQAIPVGQFKLPPEELIAQKKQKIQPTTISPSSNTGDNQKNSIPPALPAQPPPLNQKPNIKNNVPSVNLVPRKKKRSFLKFFLLFILILVIIISALIGVTYVGFKIPYISPLVKILPISTKKNFSKSKALAQEAVNKATFYNIATKITIGQTASLTDKNKTTEPPTLPGITIEDSANNQIVWKNMAVTIFGSRQSDGKTAGTIGITPANTTDASSVFQTSYDFALDQDLLYLHPLGFFDENTANWQAINRKEISDLKTPAVLLDFLDLKKLLPLFEAGRWLAKEEVVITSQDNKDLGTILANKYEITQSKISNLIKNDLAIFLFFAENESHPVKMVATANIKDKSGATISVKVESFFFNYDVKQKVKIPAQEDYTIIALNQFLVKNGFYTDSNTSIPIDTRDSLAEDHDKTRKTDLDQLAQALDQYKNDKNAYPIASDTIKTNQSSALKDALVPDYLQSLPIDPLDPDYWYGYNSDGFTYHLTSIIEGTDSSAKQGKNVRYQEVGR